MKLDWNAIQELRRFLDDSVLPFRRRWWGELVLCGGGLGEELLFRDLLQPIFTGALGVLGLVGASSLFDSCTPFR